MRTAYEGNPCINLSCTELDSYNQILQRVCTTSLLTVIRELMEYIKKGGDTGKSYVIVICNELKIILQTEFHFLGLSHFSITVNLSSSSASHLYFSGNSVTL